MNVAAYCRVSTDSDDQLQSYEAQVAYYTDHICKNPKWHFVGIYADEGITGTIVSKRERFKQMIRDCEKGKIDLILTKSVSRFARNTVDSLNYVRKLKAMGIGIFFEEQNICGSNSPFRSRGTAISTGSALVLTVFRLYPFLLFSVSLFR